MKNKKLYFILVLFAIIFTFFGGTLSFLQWRTNSEQETEVVFTVNEDFRCAADGGGNITTGEQILMPTASCTHDTYAIQKEITVNNNVYREDSSIAMDLWLNINSIDPGLSGSQYFRYALTTSPNSCSTGVVSSGTFYGKTANNQVLILDDKIYSQTKTEKYYLYLWISSEETNSNIIHQSFDFSLGGSCTNNVTVPNPKLYDVVEIGDYVNYTGNSGCTGQQCSGWNAHQTSTDNSNNYGYCHSNEYRFYTYGWRVLHKTDNSVYIVSAGAPECIDIIVDNSTSSISSLNTKALSYCNTNYLSGGICNQTTAHAFNGDDFYKFTSQQYGEENAHYLYNYNDGGTYGSPYCYYTSTEYCGYNNTIIDNGSEYWFGSAFNQAGVLYWNHYFHSVRTSTGIHADLEQTDPLGIRPVLKLDSSVLATGGTGTMTDPYSISTRTGT